MPDHSRSPGATIPSPRRSPGPWCLALGMILGLASPLIADDAPASVVNPIGIKLVRIPAGEFLMGSHEPTTAIKAAFPEDPHTPDFFNDETPQHRVRITKPFWMGQTEVTIGQFRRFVEETGYRTGPEKDGLGGWGLNPVSRKCEGRFPHFTWRDPGFPQSEQHPVLNITWHDAVAFCDWLTNKAGQRYRLPTEAEWEYACRAGSTQRYSGLEDPAGLAGISRTLDGLRLKEFAHVQDIRIPEDGSIPFTAPVGSYPANAFGLHDMHGNVWEWTNDWHADDYYANSPVEDPRGPDSGTVRVRRGGAWNSFPIWARASFRNWNSPDTRCVNLGFRVVAEEPPQRDRVSILFGGDVMLDGDPGHAVMKGVDPFADFAEILQSADLTICNLECVISEKGAVAHKPYTFRGASKSLPLLQKHFDAVSLANNHTLDFGTAGFVGQLELLEQGRLPYFGGGRNLISARRPLIFERNGLRVALLAYNDFQASESAATDKKPGVAPLEIEQVVADITAARTVERADVVIPFLHWGPELVPQPRKYQQELARRMIDAGASAIVGAHPHVTQTVDLYRGRPIIYSLGNFVFDYYPNDPPVWVGWLARLTFSKSGDVELESTAFEIDEVGIPRRFPK
ncbi:MAG: CapA family protein [Planctomycetaceae bacterium]|nr:CapA family protein [Planctomycetaceae bacterium]